MPSRHRSAYRRRQGSQARRRTAITIAIPLALAVVVGGAIAFTDGCSALATIALESDRSPLDLILLDLIMPGMDGMTVLRELRRRYKEIPVIMMSALQEREVFKEALRIGASDYVHKPLDFNILEEKCHKILED